MRRDPHEVRGESHTALRISGEALIMGTTLQEDKVRPLCLYTSIDVKVKTNMALIAALYFVRDLRTFFLPCDDSLS
jgi:hypothetical protein